MNLNLLGIKRQFSDKISESPTRSTQHYMDDSEELSPSNSEELMRRNSHHEVKPNKRFRVTSETLNNLILIDDDLASEENETINHLKGEHEMMVVEKVKDGNSNQGDLENPSIEDTYLTSLQKSAKKDNAYHNDSNSDIDMYEEEPTNFSIKSTDGSNINDKERRFLKSLDTMLNSTPGKIKSSGITQKTVHGYTTIARHYVIYCAQSNLKSFDVDGKTAWEFLRTSYIPNIAKQKGIDPKSQSIRYPLTAIRFLHGLNVAYNHYIGNVDYPKSLPNSDVLSKLHLSNSIVLSENSSPVEESFDRVSVREASIKESETRFYSMIQSLYEETGKDPFTSLKCILDILLTSTFSLSSPNKRKITLPDIFLRQQAFGEVEVPSIFISTWKGTDFDTATFSEFGSFRHSNLLSCPFSIIGLWFFFQYNSDYGKYTKPHFESNTSWYPMHLLYLKDPLVKLKKSYEEHLLDYTTRLTGIPPHEILEMAKLRPSTKLGNVEKGDSTSSCVGNLARDGVIPPPELQRKVFPWLDKDIQVATSLNNKSQSGSQYRAALAFLDLLRYLRITILQDLVVLNEKIPNNHFAKDPITRSKLYSDFRDSLLFSMKSKPPPGAKTKNGKTSIKTKREVDGAQNQDLDDIAQLIVRRTQAIQEPVTKKDLSKISDSIAGLSNIINAFSASLKPNNQQLMSNNDEVSSLVPANSSPVSQQISTADINNSLFQDDDDADDSAGEDSNRIWRMNRKIWDVPGAVYEWFYAEPNNVIIMDEKYGNSWRKVSKEAKYYRFRSVLIQFVDEQAKVLGLTLDNAAKAVENYKQQKRISLKALSMLIKDNGEDLKELRLEVKRYAEHEVDE